MNALAKIADEMNAARGWKVGDRVFSTLHNRNGVVTKVTDAGFWIDCAGDPAAATLHERRHLAEARVGGQVWLRDEENGCAGCYIGADYVDNRTWQRCTMLGGLRPVRWDEDREIELPCHHDEADYFLNARVRFEDGTEGVVPGECLLGLIESEEHLDAPPLHVLSYDEMVAMPEPEWLIEGVIQEATAGLLFGKSNAFKSFLGIDLMCSVATGTPWHGIEVKGPLPVLYVATEGARGVGKLRIPGWMDEHEIAPELRRNVTLYPQEIALDDDEAVAALLKTCAYIKARRTLAEGGKVANPDDPTGAVALVVIDIFGSSMGGPETSDETARAWVRNVNRIMREIGCAVFVIAHSGWADETRARMHTHFWGSFDSRMKADGDRDKLTTVLTIDRHKDADSTGEWGFRMEKVATPTGGTTLVPRLCDDVETGQKRRVSGKPAVALQALSEALIEHGRRVAGPSYPSCPVVSLEDWKAMCARHGLTDSDNPDTLKKSFQRAKTRLIEKGLVKQFDNVAWKVAEDD